MHWFILWACLALVAGLGSTAVAEPSTAFRNNLNQFVAEALENNPQLQEAQENIHLLQQIPDQAGSLEDPQLQLGLMNVPVDSFSFSDQPMTQKQLTLSQKLPFPGKRQLRTGLAQKDVLVAKKDREELRLLVIRDVKWSFYELCFVLASIEITQQNKSLLKQLVAIAETKYGVGKGIQQDVLKAQVELSKIIDELILLEEKKNGEQARLNFLMNRLPQAPLTILHGIHKTPFGFTIEELQAKAEKHRPLLNEISTLIDKAHLSKKLAKKELYPDFNVGLRYGRRESLDRPQSNPDFVSAFVSFNIPVWRKSRQDRKVIEENHRILKMEKKYQHMRNRIFLELKRAVDSERKESDLIELIQSGIIPQAEQSLKSAIAAYSVDKVDFLTLLDNQVTLFKWKIKHHRELADHEKTLANIEYLVGKKLF